MSIRRLRLENWLCYRGVVDLRLEPTAYAVHAEMDGDPDRSNFLGKSALGESVLFALAGWLSPERHFDSKDAWISNGESAGSVLLELDDGHVVERSKRAGKSGQLEVSRGGSTLRQAEAQALLDGLVGMSVRDLQATLFAMQREAGFLVRSRGSELDEVFAEWLGLEKMDRAEARLEKAASGEASAREGLDRSLEGLRVQESETIAQAGSREAMVRDREEVGRLAEEIAGLEARLRVALAARADAARLAQVDRIQQEGAELRARYDSMDHAARRRNLAIAEDLSQVARVNANHVDKDRRHLTELAKGKFDGTCPVARFECPVSDRIRKDKERFLALEQEAIALVAEKQVILEKEHHHLCITQAQVQEADRLAERLQTMRDQAEKIHASVGDLQEEPEDVAALEAQIAERRALAQAARDSATRHQVHAEQADRASAQVRLLEPRIEAARARESVLSAAAMVVRRSRREILRSALIEIQDGANADLADLGVDLGVELRWEREGKDPARCCEFCGLAFPPSARVKACPCGAARGFQKVQRVEVRMTARSGGAEDLAGLVLQLAAGRWLLSERGAGWDVAWLDEAISALDPAHRRMVAQHLPRMLRRAGLSQAFVVSHDPRSAAALPARIVVRSDGQWSRAEVA